MNTSDWSCQSRLRRCASISTTKVVLSCRQQVVEEKSTLVCPGLSKSDRHQHQSGLVTFRWNKGEGVRHHHCPGLDSVSSCLCLCAWDPVGSMAPALTCANQRARAAQSCVSSWQTAVRHGRPALPLERPRGRCSDWRRAWGGGGQRGFILMCRLTFSSQWLLRPS